MMNQTAAAAVYCPQLDGELPTSLQCPHQSALCRQRDGRPINRIAARSGHYAGNSVGRFPRLCRHPTERLHNCITPDVAALDGRENHVTRSAPPAS